MSSWPAPHKDEGAREAEDVAFNKAREAALRFLTYRARSEAEVRNRLGRNYPPEIIEGVVGWLNQRHYLDDLDFARQWRRKRERLRPKGQRAIRQELLRLGVAEEVIAEALTGFEAEANAYQAAWQRAKHLKLEDYQRFRQQLWGYLRRRGFDDSQIGDTVSPIWRELTADPLHRSVNPDGDKE